MVPRFWPTPEEIIPLAEENLYSNLVYAWGPGIIENPPFISDAYLDKIFFHPFLDTVKITAIEKNPDNHTSEVSAKIFEEDDSLLSEIKLNKTDSLFTGSFQINQAGEKFYKMILYQRGIDIPSNFYYDTIKFTSAGPLIVDSVSYNVDGYGWANIKPYVKNLGNATTIKNVSISIVNKDSIIIASYPRKLELNDIAPNSIVSSKSGFNVNYDISKLPGNFKLKFEISSNDFVYWTDSTKVILTGIDE